MTENHGELHVEAHVVGAGGGGESGYAPVTLNLANLNFAQLKTEVDAGLQALLTGLVAAQKLSGLFPTAQLTHELTAAIQILTTIKSVIDKVL